MHMKNRTLFFFIGFALVILSCKKEEGIGGTATIAGKIWVQDYSSDFSILKAEYWGQEVDVYIMYGNDSIYSTRTKTNYDGSYWFQYLQEGDYTIFAYSRDSSKVNPSPSGRVAIKVPVHVNKKGDRFIAPQINIID